MIYMPQFDGQLYGLDRIKARQPEVIRKAKESFQIHGDPIDGLEELLGNIFPSDWCSVCNQSMTESVGRKIYKNQISCTVRQTRIGDIIQAHNKAHGDK